MPSTVIRRILGPVLGLALAGATSGFAADHQEAPGTSADPAADIADLYAWHDAGSDRLTLALTYAGLSAPAPRARAMFDPDVVYSFHLDRDGDAVAEVVIEVSFVPDGRKWRMRIENLPGSVGPVVAAVERPVDLGQFGRAYAGLRDDPFFFDLEGFLTTLQTGTLSFDGTRDSVAGLNASAIVLEMSLADALGTGSTLGIWATTARQ